MMMQLMHCLLIAVAEGYFLEIKGVTLSLYFIDLYEERGPKDLASSYALDGYIVLNVDFSS